MRTRYAVSGMIPSEKELNEEREKLGLNDPILVQYGRWFSKVRNFLFEWKASSRAFIRKITSNIKTGICGIASYAAICDSARDVIGSL